MLLQVSGFGPCDILHELGVDVAADLPGVGRNLQDHPMVQILYNCKHTSTPSLIFALSADRLVDTAPGLMSAQRIAHNDTLRGDILKEYTANKTGAVSSPCLPAPPTNRVCRQYTYCSPALVGPYTSPMVHTVAFPALG